MAANLYNDLSAVPGIWWGKNWRTTSHFYVLKSHGGTMSKRVRQYAAELTQFFFDACNQVEEDTVPEVQHWSLQNCQRPTLISNDIYGKIAEQVKNTW